MSIEKFKLELNKKIVLALKKAANHILTEADEIIPVNTSNLANSKYDKIHNQNRSIELGYTANYAKYVHEMQNVKFKRPSAKAKFLQITVANNREKVINIIQRILKV